MTDDAAVVPPFRVSPARTQRDLEAVADLFAAYAASLPVDLEYQDFRSEVAELPGKYAHPDGELLVAWDERGRHVACVGLRPLASGDRCEMKRLYVVPEARSFGLGKKLTEEIVSVATQRGFAELYLDTLPMMQRRRGFTRAWVSSGSTLTTGPRRPGRFS
jgi:N-acetylglutamate synthase-like GNAT family acetyltransferase